MLEKNIIIFKITVRNIYYVMMIYLGKGGKGGGLFLPKAVWILITLHSGHTKLSNNNFATCTCPIYPVLIFPFFFLKIFSFF